MRVPMCIFAAALLCTPAAALGERADLSGVTSWAYWLQAPDIDALIASSFDVVVIDYSYDGSADGEFSSADIGRIRDSGKTVLAYCSIGEAESYRFYWQSSWKPGKPRFIAAENPDWPENYNVKFWTKNWWRRALQPYLDRILAAGFDGVYLDRVDAYWWWHEQKGVDARRSANRMAKLVEKIALYTRERAGDGFIVCPQNGVAILDDASSSLRNRYLAAVDAVAVESLYYNIWSAEDRAYRLALLEQFAAENKKIFVVEYIAESTWDEFFATLAASGLDMVGYPAAPDQALDELILID